MRTVFIRALCSLGLVISLSVECGAQDFKPMNSTSFEDAATEATPKVPKKRFSEAIILRHRTLFKALCDAVQKDGRKDTLFAMLDLNAYKDESCLACRPLLKAFASGCKPGRVASAKKGDAPPTPTPIPKQREPNLEVLSYVSTIFSELAEDAKDSEVVDEILKGLDRLTAVLTAEEGKTQAEREYFGTISEYANTPFKDFVKEVSQQQRELPKFSEDSKQENLDDLFGR